MRKKKWHIGKSDIHGKGVFASRTIKPFEYIGTAIIFVTPSKSIITKDFGVYINHKSYPQDNSHLERVGNKYFLVSNTFIPKGKEILADYDQLPLICDSLGCISSASEPHYK